MEIVSQRDNLDAETKQRILNCMPQDQMPQWALVLANSNAALQRHIAEREDRWEFFDPEDHYLTLFATTSVTCARQCTLFAAVKLRALGFDDERLVNLATMASTVYRNMLLTTGLGVENQYEKTAAVVDLPDLDEQRAKSFDTVPNWARAMSHKPQLLDRLLIERQQDLGFGSERWTMVGLAVAIATVGARSCVASHAARLKAESQWSDAKLVEFVSMISRHESHRVLFDTLGISA